MNIVHWYTSDCQRKPASCLDPRWTLLVFIWFLGRFWEDSFSRPLYATTNKNTFYIHQHLGSPDVFFNDLFSSFLPDLLSSAEVQYSSFELLPTRLPKAGFEKYRWILPYLWADFHREQPWTRGRNSVADPYWNLPQNARQQIIQVGIGWIKIRPAYFLLGEFQPFPISKELKQPLINGCLKFQVLPSLVPTDSPARSWLKATAALLGLDSMAALAL